MRIEPISTEQLVTVIGGIDTDCEKFRGLSGRFKPEYDERDAVRACVEAGHPWQK